MNISFGNKMAADWGVGRETIGAQEGLAAGGKAATTSGALHRDSGVTITMSAAAPEDISAAAIPESALSRDDDLGKLVSSAFALPAPPMPNFTP